MGPYLVGICTISGLTVTQRSGYNAYHNYNIFKDDKHAMYTAGNGAVCRSIYYCLIVSRPGVVA